MVERGCEPIAQPLDINGVRLANRIVVPVCFPFLLFTHTPQSVTAHAHPQQPMGTNRDMQSAEGIAWYSLLARSGAGLVIVESTPLSGFAAGRFTAASLAPVAAAIHAGGARAVLQVFPTLGTLAPRAPPAAVPAAVLADLPAQYAAAAHTCRAAGFDGLEVHGAHGFTLSQFASRACNMRTDRYGTARPTLARALVAAVRAACPDPGFLVLYRHTIPDPASPTDRADAAALVAALEDAGLDTLDLSPAGTYARPGCHARALRRAAAECGRALRVPVIGDCGLNDPACARAAVAAGDVDLAAVGRGHIADPAWSRKVLAHRDSDIVPCLRCNIGCHQNLRCGTPIRCVLDKCAKSNESLLAAF